MTNPRRGHQQLDALIKIGEGMNRKLTQKQIDLAHTMAKVMVRRRGDHDAHPDLETVARHTRKYLAELAHAFEDAQSDDVDFLYSLALILTESELDTPPELRGRKPRPHRHALRTPEQIIRAIAACVTDIDSGDLTPQAARARLHALQTLLVAIRMKNERPQANPLPELKAMADEGESVNASKSADVIARVPVRAGFDLDAELRHLQHMTAEPGE